MGSHPQAAVGGGGSARKVNVGADDHPRVLRTGAPVTAAAAVVGPELGVHRRGEGYARGRLHRSSWLQGRAVGAEGSAWGGYQPLRSSLRGRVQTAVPVRRASCWRPPLARLCAGWSPC